MDKQIYKIIETKEKLTIRLHLKVLENSLELIILESGKVWKSNVMFESLECFVKEYKLTTEEYCSKLINYINVPNSEVEFSLNNDKFTINQKLKKSLMLIFFTCNLIKENYTKSVESILDELFNEKLKLLNELKVTKIEKEEHKKSKTECESKLKDLIKQKLSDEDELYGKFLLILNEKKKKIQHLTELLEALQDGIHPPEPKTTKKRKFSKKEAEKKEVVSESENSESLSNYESDGEISEKSKSDSDEAPAVIPDSLSFLEDDTEDAPTLPKLARREQNKDFVVASTSKRPLTQPEEPKTVQKRKSPEIDINTQELLDLL